MRYGNEQESPWEGAAKWVQVRGCDEVGRVIVAGKNIGYEYCYAVLFESTGEIKYYRTQDCTRCDRTGNTQPS